VFLFLKVSSLLLPRERCSNAYAVSGLYLSLTTDIWGEITKLFDELWFVEVDRNVARRRLIARHLASGICDTEEAAAKRADENDLPNGDYIVANMAKPDRVIQNIEDEEYANSQ
jgi:pantothenate kinase